MIAHINPSPLSGSIPAIASKSVAHRVLICAALAGGKTHIACPTTSVDIEATAECLRGLGCEVTRVEDGFELSSALDESNLQQADVAELNCQESGSTLRFLLPVVAALGRKAAFTGSKRLAQRPLSPLYEELEAKGIRLSEQGAFPLTLEGSLESGIFEIPGNISSQYISGLLMAAPLLEGDTTIHVSNPVESKPYVDLTISALSSFGVNVEEIHEEAYTSFIVRSGEHYEKREEAQVEGDWSNAAFWLCAGAMGSESIQVTGLKLDSAQGDRAVLGVLAKFGARVLREQDSVTVSPDKLQGITLDAHDFPDLVPPLAMVAAVAEGETRITGAERLRIKESDRLESVSAVIRSLGGTVEVLQDGLVIQGKPSLAGGACEAQNDHRICMQAAIGALKCEGKVTISGAECVNKSYPTFFKDYERLGGTVRIEE